jgi:hypothetical protein
VSIEKPRHIGLYTRPSVLDSRDITVFIGVVFFMLVIGALLLSGAVLLGQLAFPRKVLVIETSNETYYFTRPHGIDEKIIKEMVAKTYSVFIDKEAQTTSDNARRITHPG